MRQQGMTTEHADALEHFYELIGRLRQIRG